MDETPQGENGLLATVTRLFQTVHNMAANRVELFLTELIEERMRLFDALLLAAVAIVSVLMTLLLLTFTVVFVFWDTHRELVLTLATVGYAVVATVALVKLRSRLQRWRAFSVTLQEFKKDCACFKKPS